MQESWIVLLGGNELNAGFCELAAKWGSKLAIVDWNEKPAIPCDWHIRLDIKAATEVEAAVREIAGKIRFAYTSVDVATESVARINAAEGLARPPADALVRARDKPAMSAAWADAKLLGKQYAACTSAADLAAFARDFRGKLIVKPADASSSRGITVVEADEIGGADWAAIFQRAAGAAWNGVALAEEYIDGTEYTVEMIGDAEGHVEVWGVSKKYHTANTGKNRIAVKLHYNPPDVPRERLQRIASFAGDCYRALGLNSTLGHFEVMEARDGRLVPVEMAARSSGYIATHLVSVLSDAPGAYLSRYGDVLRGATIRSGLIPSDRSSMYFFYDPSPGIWQKNDANLMQYLPGSIRSLANLRARLRTGLNIAHIDTDNERYGFEVLVAPRADLIIENVMSAERRLYADAVESALVPASPA